MDPLSAILQVSGKVIDRLWPDPTQAAQAKLELFKLQQTGELAQITGQLEINKTEAASSSVFVAGWRPAIGWVCAFALFYQYIGKPISQAIAVAIGHPLPVLPGLDDNLWQLLLGMLGLGGLRTFEKINGVAK